MESRVAVPVVQGMVQGEGQVLSSVRAEMGSSRAWSVYDARESCDVGVGGSCSQATEAGATSCGTEVSLSTREKRKAADELASLEAALSALGATRGTTQIAQESRSRARRKR